MVKVKPTANQGRITVQSDNDTTIFSIKDNLSEYYAKQAENWAHSEGMVNGIDYSSKYYAEKSKESANKAEIHKNNTLEAINGFDENVQVAKDDIEQSRINSINAINSTYSVAILDMQEKSDEVLTSIESLKVEAVDSINSTKTTILNDIEFVAEGEKKEIEDLIDSGKEEIQELTNEIKENAEDIINRVGFNMFDTILKDHVLTYEESKGLALQGTYVYKDAIAGSRYGYPDFYAKCLEEYNEAIVTETVNGVTIKVHSNGHKFYDIAVKASIDAFYNSIGTAWMYGIDTENERIFLPRDKYFAVNGVAPVVGNGMTLGLYYGSTNVGLYGGNDFGLWCAQDVYGASVNTTPSSTIKPGNKSMGVTTDPTKSGVEAHLEPSEDKYLYICVGNTVSNTSWVDVVTQVKGGVKDLEDATNEGISALANASNALRTTQITNCLSEVPQRIKVELNNGTLTTKAGSVFIVPDGFEADGTTPKFDYITIPHDVKLTIPISGSAMFVYNTVTNGYDYMDVALGFSGSSHISSTGGISYNTTTNNVRIYSNANVVYSDKVSLPFVLVTGNGTQITSIDQVFNGMGYIGSTVWVDKGVKGLIPNGRNEDGTLNNIEFQNNTLDTITFTNDIKGVYFGCSMDGAPQLNGLYSYDEKDNYVYNGENKVPVLYCGTYDVVGGKVANFQPKQPFRAVDYNDKAEIVSWGMPDYSAGVSITQDTNYTAQYACYIYLQVTSNSSNSNTHVAKNIVINGVTVASPSAHQYNSIPTMVLCPKGATYRIQNVNTGTGSYTAKVYPLKGDRNV